MRINIIILFGLLLVSSFLGCGEERAKQAFKNGHKQGYNKGYIEGHEEGKKESNIQAEKTNLIAENSGFSNRYSQGYDDAKSGRPNLIEDSRPSWKRLGIINLGFLIFIDFMLQ